MHIGDGFGLIGQGVEYFTVIAFAVSADLLDQRGAGIGRLHSEARMQSAVPRYKVSVLRIKPVVV